LYSTEQHGCSLRTLYRRIEQRGGTVLVIRDALGHVFGAFVAEDWHPSASAHTTPTYFGNGETFLFKCNGETLERYGWTQANDHFVLAAADCVAFGSGDLGFALYLDNALERGSSAASETFGNPCLAGSKDFSILKCEVWGFAW
jgi:hypothetical protein